MSDSKNNSTASPGPHDATPLEMDTSSRVPSSDSFPSEPAFTGNRAHNVPRRSTGKRRNMMEKSGYSSVSLRERRGGGICSTDIEQDIRYNMLSCYVLFFIFTF